MTRLEKIQNFTVEEMVDFIKANMSNYSCACCARDEYLCCGDCTSGIRDWLEKEENYERK